MQLWWGSGSSGRWASVAADNLRSYVRDSDPLSIGKKAVSSELYYGCYIGTEAKSAKQLCTKKQRGC
jgi:hypothetical protein